MAESVLITLVGFEVELVYVVCGLEGKVSVLAVWCVMIRPCVLLRLCQL